LDIQNKLPTSLTSEKRQLLDSTTTTNGNDVVTISRTQGTTHDSIGYSWKPKSINNIERRQLAKDTGTTTTKEGGFAITTSKHQGTTGDRVGYRWEPEPGAILRRQVGGDQVVRNGQDEVIVSKSQGTTRDRHGFKWRKAGVL
jgi:hypothetical protein